MISSEKYSIMKKLAQYDGADNLPALGAVELIESLRAVARAASRTCITNELAEALDALPTWALED